MATPMPATRPWPAILARLVAREGRLVNHPLDKGGPTNSGITLATLERAWERRVDLATLAALTDEQKAAIYWRLYVCDPHSRYANLILPEHVLEAILDAAVLFGNPRCNIWLQEIANGVNAHRMPAVVPLKADGVLGPLSQAALHQLNPHLLPPGLALRRLARHCKAVKRDPGQAIFLGGWSERALELAGDLAAVRS